MLEYKEDRSWQEELQPHVIDWWETVERRAGQEADPINPGVFMELSPMLPDRCIVTAGSGTSAFWYARNLKIREGMMDRNSLYSYSSLLRVRVRICFSRQHEDGSQSPCSWLTHRKHTFFCRKTIAIICGEKIENRFLFKIAYF